MLIKNSGLTLVLMALFSHANAQIVPASEAGKCPTEVEEFFDSIVGEWNLFVQADEGWTGYGDSSISWTEDQKCGVFEQTVAVFNQESEDPTKNSSTSYLVYDELSETIKILTADSRGYVHVGIAAVEETINFEILKPSSETPNRRIQYRRIQPTSFEWSWQGRSNPSEDWQDRLIINYERSR